MVKEVIISGVQVPSFSVQGKDFLPIELWTCNTGYKNAPVLSTLFIMHKQVYEKGKPVFDWDEINRHAEVKGFKIISQFDIPELEYTNLYPYGAVSKYFKTDYFASSFDYMVAYALLMGYKKIDFYDTGFVAKVSDKTDDFWERCGLEYWIGRANGMGVETYIDKSCYNLLNTRTGLRYAFDG